VAIFSAICGFLLILIAWFGPLSDKDFFRYRWPLFAVGMAIIMGAAGAQIVARLKWLVAGGAAAMVLVFAYILKPDPLPPSPPYLYGYIRTTEELRGLVVYTGVPLLVGHRGEITEFQFFGLENDLRGERFWIQAKNKAGDFVILGCLSMDLLRNKLGNKDGADFTLGQDRKEPQNWYLQETGKPDKIGEYGNPGCASPSGPPVKGATLNRHPMNFLRSFFLPTAYAAQGVPATGDPRALIGGLRSPDFTEQTQVQSVIAGMRNQAQITALVRLWQTDNPPSDIIPSLLIAWVQAIRGDRIVASYIGQVISAQLMRSVIELAGNHDRVIRFNATEFISWVLQSTRWPTELPSSQIELISKEVARPLDNSNELGILSDSPKEFLVYNLLVAIKDAACLHEARPLNGRLYSAVAHFLASADDPSTQASERTKQIAGQILRSCTRPN
jgi:hypothetical protein